MHPTGREYEIIVYLPRVEELVSIAGACYDVDAFVGMSLSPQWEKRTILKDAYVYATPNAPMTVVLSRNEWHNA